METEKEEPIVQRNKIRKSSPTKTNLDDLTRSCERVQATRIHSNTMIPQSSKI
jgi:hypothetical protein